MTLFSLPRRFVRTISVHSIWRISNFNNIKPRNFASTQYLLFASVRNMSVDKKAFERLPTNVLPKNYQITLHPNLTEFTFAGKEVVEVEVRFFFVEFSFNAYL